MARSIPHSAPRGRAIPKSPLTARSVVLAGVGALLRGRREALALVGAARQRMAPLQRDAVKLGRSVELRLAGAARRIQPLLARLGLPPVERARPARNTASRPAAKRSAARRRAA